MTGDQPQLDYLIYGKKTLASSTKETLGSGPPDKLFGFIYSFIMRNNWENLPGDYFDCTHSNQQAVHHQTIQSVVYQVLGFYGVPLQNDHRFS